MIYCCLNYQIYLPIIIMVKDIRSAEKSIQTRGLQHESNVGVVLVLLYGAGVG
jgi:hypothetical protein